MISTVIVNVGIEVVVIHPNEMTDMKVEESAKQSIQIALAEVDVRSEITSIGAVIKKE